MNNPDTWVTRSELTARANAQRRTLSLPPLTATASGSLWARLPRRKRTSRNYEYHLETALPILLRPRNRHDRHPIHRTATQQELESGELIAFCEGCRLLGLNPQRLKSHVSKLCIRALRHPVTNRVWVRVSELLTAAYYRSASFILKHCTPEQTAHIMHARPYLRRFAGGIVRRVYFAPELVHL